MQIGTFDRAILPGNGGGVPVGGPLVDGAPPGNGPRGGFPGGSRKALRRARASSSVTPCKSQRFKCAKSVGTSHRSTNTGSKVRSILGRCPMGRSPFPTRIRGLSHLYTNIEQSGHQGALVLHDCPSARKWRPSKKRAGTLLLSRLSRLAISRREITRSFPTSCKVIRFQLSELIVVSTTAPIRTHKTRCTENRRFSGPAIPPPRRRPGARAPPATDPTCQPMTGQLHALPSQSQRPQSGWSSALSRARAPRCEAIALPHNKNRRTDVRPRPTRSGCQPQDQRY
jgi:hypothetical protein